MFTADMIARAGWTEEGNVLILAFFSIYIFMLVFCEKWNIIRFEASNYFAS